ncbi:MAG: Smr/MutS family protein [Thermoanaerobaculia bacterium]|nr:Smr/MutS family protein [Thermoanaerobaculia bacterium]
MSGNDSREEVREPVEIGVEDVLDLHSFPPGQVSELVRDYLDLAWEAGFQQVRIIHGRGKGIQRKTVRTLLERDPRIEAFGDSPLGSGGWGATWARFARSGRGPS